MGGILCPLGTDPLRSRSQIPWMPKGRYQVMRHYMPTKGRLGIDMMIRTCTVQVNLDFRSESDMVAKMRLGMALQPLATALFACSPFLEGKFTGYQSYRAHIWQDTDPDRCGLLPLFLSQGWALSGTSIICSMYPCISCTAKGPILTPLGNLSRIL
jgi:glutamate--cysteine ligase